MVACTRVAPPLMAAATCTARVIVRERNRTLVTTQVRGVVYLVGAGPGDPGLLTVRGRALLDSCDAIAVDALANPSILASARVANPGVEVHDVGKRGGSSESTPSAHTQ